MVSHPNSKSNPPDLVRVFNILRIVGRHHDAIPSIYREKEAERPFTARLEVTVHGSCKLEDERRPSSALLHLERLLKFGTSEQVHVPEYGISCEGPLVGKRTTSGGHANYLLTEENTREDIVALTSSPKGWESSFFDFCQHVSENVLWSVFIGREI